MYRASLHCWKDLLKGRGLGIWHSQEQLGKVPTTAGSSSSIRGRTFLKYELGIKWWHLLCSWTKSFASGLVSLTCSVWDLPASLPPASSGGAFDSMPIVPCLLSIIDCSTSHWSNLIRWEFAGFWLAAQSSGGTQVLGHLHFTSSALILTFFWSPPSTGICRCRRSRCHPGASPPPGASSTSSHINAKSFTWL